MSTHPPVIKLKDQRADKLGAEITELYGLITAGTYDLLVKIREFDAAELWSGPGMTSCAHWLNWQCGIGMNAAREKVRVARALGELPKISEAFRNGEVSYSKVRAMTRVASIDNEDYLLMIARHGTAHHVEDLVRGYRRALRLNEPDLARSQFDTRCFHYHWDDDGSLVFKGRLPAEVGAMLMKAFEASVDRRGRENTAVNASEERETCESLPQKRADAIAEMAETYLANSPVGSSSADRYQVMLHVSAETSEALIENGPHVTAETSRRICCDSSISRMVEDETGNPLSIGRKSRIVPPPMRRALKARDKQCRFPGCTHQLFNDAHHIEHWADGGETSLDNLALLCRHHHRLVHEGGFTCEKNNEKLIFRDPRGRSIPDSGQLPGYRDNVFAHFDEILEDSFIHAQSIVPDWHGERMDRDLAVSHLWDINHPETFT